MRSDVPDQLAPPERSGKEIGRHVDEILSRPEFQEPPKSLYDRVVELINELIGDVLGQVIGGARGSVIGLVLVGVLIATLIAVWVRFVPTMSRDARARGREIDVDRVQPARDWVAQAEAAAATGNWREALRCRYRALIARLAERGVIEEVPGRTAGEYRRELHRAFPSAAPHFNRATELFELAWYGGRSADSDDHAAFVEVAGRVIGEVRT